MTERGHDQPEQNVTAERKERGSNVTIQFKIMRHGEREGTELLDIGRETTRQRAQESGLEKGKFHAVKAIGSPADPNPKTEKGYGRSLETSDIYAQEIAGDQAFRTRAEQVLNFQTLVSPRPYNHTAVYDSFLPENFSQLPAEEKVKASKKAQIETYKHLMTMDTKEAEQFRREMAGAFAYLIEHYEQVRGRLKSGSRVLIPAGSHSPMIELILHYALVRRNPDGTETKGLNPEEPAGADFDPSEAYNVFIETDEKGQPKPLKVTFDNPNRPAAEEMFLDPIKVHELAEFYKELHPAKT